MKWIRRDRPRPDRARGTGQHAEQGQESPRRSPGPARTGPNRWGARAVVVAFYGVIAAIGVAAVTGLANSVTAQDPEPVAVAQEHTTRAESLAQHYVAAWLSASRDNQQLVESIAGTTLPIAPENPLEFKNLAVADVSASTDSKLVSVTVSAIITEPAAPRTPSGTAAPDSEQAATVAVRYYQVAIAQQDDALAVVGYPTPVAGPPRAQPVTLAYPQTVTEGTPLGQAVTGFLRSYAAGGGDVSRYTAPGTELGAITPAPYQDVHITQIRTDADSKTGPVEGQQAHVVVNAEAVLPTGASSRQAVTWALTLQARADRWEVTALNPAPLTDGPDQPTRTQN